MKIKIEDLNLRISNEVTREIPEWFTPDIEFDFEIKVRAGNIVLVKDYDGHSVVVVWLWQSWAPPITEKRVGEVYFRNAGTEEEPEILSAARLV